MSDCPVNPSASIYSSLNEGFIWKDKYLLSESFVLQRISVKLVLVHYKNGDVNYPDPVPPVLS